MLQALEPVIADLAPDVVLVYEDTTSTLAGALVAAGRDIPVANVEAGLRSFDRRMPEERNRVVTDRLSNLLFVPTSTGVHNLEREWITDGVELVGDVMLDAFLQTLVDLDPARDLLKSLGLARNTCW
jgi:UDP-N-acetylglucosamine 2-epimerase